MANTNFAFANPAIIPPWIIELCDYYNVTPKEAYALGERKKGRKPQLPGSITCSSVENLTYEDIWSSNPRNNEAEIFQFYKDMGAWCSFRQCNRHMNMQQFHMSMLSMLKLQEHAHYVEYGCGVAPFTWTLLHIIHDNANLTISLSDVESEHFEFAKWRLQRLITTRNLHNIKINIVPIRPAELPEYKSKINAVIAFEVLEHIANPHIIMKNLFSQMAPGASLVENFIDHPIGSSDDSDLPDAAKFRNDYYTFLKSHATCVYGPTIDKGPNDTRLWIKNNEKRK